MVNYAVLSSGCFCWTDNHIIINYKYHHIKMEVATKLPNQLNYQKIAPKGYPCIYKQWINDPLTGNKTWANNDIIRWNFMNSKRGTFDPYRSFIQITVSVDQNNLPIGLLQVDNSAHSFINQIVLYSNNRQIQRITEYGVLLAYLNDIGMNQFLSQGRQVQGLGYGNIDSSPFLKSSTSVISQPRNVGKSSAYMTGTYSTNNIFPTIGNGYSQDCQYYGENSIYNASRGAKGHITNANPCITSDPNGGSVDADWSPVWACLNQNGWANNLRTDYFTPFIQNKFPQSPHSIPNYELMVSGSVTRGQYPCYYAPGVKYQTYVRGSLKSSRYNNTQHTQVTNIINSSNYGFSSLFCHSFARGTFQPFISPTVPQCMLTNGNITHTKFPIYRRKFKIPLASAVIGCLVDSSSYCLIPLQSINDLLLELTLDPYAMFTSGYNDICEFDNVGMGVQQKRCYQIDRIQYKLHTYFFTDSQVQQYIKSSLYQEIVLVNNFWSLGNQYQIGGGTLVNNSYIVGCSSQNLNQLVCLFVANDYQQYSFCRKHFRLSNNIRRFWSKLSVDYWPPQPFKGNGGNAYSNNFDDDNSIFIENLLWANNYMFSNNSQPRINIYNFAINNRCYDPTNKKSLYPIEANHNQSFAFAQNSINSDTAMGMPFIHQNRYVGKAAYMIVYTPFTQQEGLLQGINVSGLSNFEVVFETDTTQVFPRDQTLYIFCKSSVICKYTKDGIITIGR